jgi:site-specific DNA recombinase
MNTTTNHKLFLYARKSTDDLSRQVRSIDDQLAELRELAKQEHITIVEELVERQTAKKPGRPVFNAMLERIEKGEADGVLAWHPDRLSRNSIDAGRIIWLIDTGTIKALRFPTYFFEPSAHGKFSLSLMLSQSKYYIDNLSENIRRGQRQKVKNGIWPMVAPIGYLNDHASKTIYIDPQRGPLIRKAFELYATGEYTLDQLTDTVNTLGLITRHGEPLSRSQYHRLLRHPIYHGLIDYKGELYQGTHEPLIGKALFDAVGEVATEKSKPRSPKFKPYIYRGIFRCGECGRLVTTETQKGHNYLRCTKWKVVCSQPFVRQEVMEQQIGTAIGEVATPDDITDWLIAEFEGERQHDHEANKTAREDIRRKIADHDEKLERLMTLYLDKALTLEEYRKTKNQLVTDREVLTSSLTAFEHNRSIPFEPALRFVNSMKQATKVATIGNPTEQRDFLRKAASNFSVRDKRLVYKFHEPWQLVADQRFPDEHQKPAPVSGAGSPTEIDLCAKKRRR